MIEPIAPPPEREYELECIVGQTKQGRTIHYTVKWVGFEETSLEPEANLLGTATEAIDRYHDLHPRAHMSANTRARRLLRIDALALVNAAIRAQQVDDDGAPLPPLPPPPLPPNLAWSPEANMHHPHARVVAPLTRLPTSTTDMWSELIPIIATLHARSRPVLSLAPYCRLPTDRMRNWGRAMDAAGTCLRTAIDEFLQFGDELKITNAVIEHLLELPTRELMPIMDLKPVGGIVTVTFDDDTPSYPLRLGPDPAPREDDGDWTPTFHNLQVHDHERNTMMGDAKRAIISSVNLIYKDRTKTACKSIIGNGQAESSLATFQLLSEMHIKREGPIHLPEIVGDQIVVEWEDCLEKLILEAGKKDASTGVYGISAAMHYHQRGRRGDSLMKEVARLQALIGSGRLPDAVYFLMTAGGLTALLKEDLAQQELRRLALEPPKVRPINSGCSVLKVPLSVVSQHSSAQACRAEMRTIAFGDGVAGGPESVVHLTRMEHKAGATISTEDTVNAFGSLKRNTMLQTQAEVWTPATLMFRKLYGNDSPCLYSYKDADGLPCLGITRSEEGSRMGCTLGSISFNLTAYHKIYKPASIKFPDLTFRALTDDLTVIMPPVFEMEAQQEQYRLSAKVVEFIDECMAPCGLKRHPGKGFLLLGQGRAEPDADSPIREMTKVTTDGVKLAGAWIGSDVQTAEAAMIKARSLQPRMDAIVELSLHNPQAANSLLANALNCAMDYYVRTTPPNLLGQAACHFEGMIMDTFSKIISSDDRRLPLLSDARSTRANELRKLPLIHGGFGHTSLLLKAPAAYIAAALTTMKADPKIYEMRATVAANLVPCYEYLLTALDVADFSDLPEIRKVIPASPAALIRALPTDPARPITKTSAMRKVQGVLVEACGRVALRNFRFVYGSSCRIKEGTTQADLAHVQLMTSRSQLSRAYCASLFYQHNRLSRDEFINGARYHLNLPQLVRWGDGYGNLLGLDDTQELNDQGFCAVDHGTVALLDPTGQHACFCKSGKKAKYQMHSQLNLTFQRFAREAGGHTEREPGTSSILMNKIAPAHVRLMFSKTNNAQQRARQTIMTILSNNFLGTNDGERRRRLAQQMQQLADQSPKEWKGLRIDLRVSFPDAEVWIDGSIRHPTAATQLPRVTAWTHKLLAAEADALAGGGGRNLMDREASPMVSVACAQKHKTYGPLLETARRQHTNKDRPFAPVFVAGVISHAGEMAPELIGMVEFFTNQYAKHISTMGFEDGVPKARRTADYRCRFKDALMTTVLRGFGRTLGAVGLPWDQAGALPLYEENRVVPRSREGRR